MALFFAVWATGLGAAALVRRAHAHKRPRTSASTPELDAYEAAYLANGAERLTEAVIGSLVHEGAFRAGGTRLFAQDRDLSDLHPLECAAYRRCATSPDRGATVGEVRQALEEPARDVADRLESAGLLFSPAESRRCLFMALAAPSFGAVKVGVGLALDKPVGFLIALCVVSTLVAFAWFGSDVQRTATGNALLERLRQHASIPESGSEGVAPSPHVPVAVAVALFGAHVLVNLGLSEAAALFAPRSSSGGVGGCSAQEGGAAAEDDGGDGDDGCGGCGGCGGG